MPSIQKTKFLQVCKNWTIHHKSVWKMKKKNTSKLFFFANEKRPLKTRVVIEIIVSPFETHNEFLTSTVTSYLIEGKYVIYNWQQKDIDLRQKFFFEKKHSASCLEVQLSYRTFMFECRILLNTSQSNAWSKAKNKRIWYSYYFHCKALSSKLMQQIIDLCLFQEKHFTMFYQKCLHWKFRRVLSRLAIHWGFVS